MTTRGPAQHLPLSVPVYQILLSLSDRELHGYALILDIGQRTAGEVRLTASTLYGAAKRMLDSGLIRELDERPAPELDDQRRRYYAITPFGRETLREEALRLERALGQALRKHVLGEVGMRNGETV